MSKIEWTGETWNPIAGCSPASPGCTNCYAMRMAHRLEAMADAGAKGVDHYRGLTTKSRGGQILWTGKIGIAPDDVLTKPLRWKKPRMIFVNSMSDLFHPDVPDEVIDRVFAVMALCPQHIFQVLTKRADRMREYISRAHDQWHGNSEAFADRFQSAMDWNYAWINDIDSMSWPLPNVWLGVSVEDQARADERIPDLLATPAAVRWLSCEPLLGPVDLTDITIRVRPGEQPCGLAGLDAMTGVHWDAEDTITGIYGQPDPRINWIVVGGESGKCSRPIHPDWARSLRDQCAEAGVPFFFKQWGDWSSDLERTFGARGDTCFLREPSKLFFTRIGKAKAGRLLDGQLHDAMPDGAA